MGSDNLYHRRKAKTLDTLTRRVSKRSSYDRVLIVCEGKKTEPNYFSDLVRYYRINSANVAIDGSSESSPCKVYERAVEIAKLEAKKGDPFDRIYCVFDKDSHTTYSDTLTKIANTRNFYAANSIPCFEYWLLLHFTYTTKGYSGNGNKSVADNLIKDLKKFIPDYTKGSKGVFEDLLDKIETAKANAKRALNDAQRNNTDNPSTYIHELVEYLQNFKM